LEPTLNIPEAEDPQKEVENRGIRNKIEESEIMQRKRTK